jgi:hypothetical protein
MEKFPLKFSHALYAKFKIIWGKQFDGDDKSDDYLRMWAETWSEALSGIDPSSVKPALAYCEAYLEWPPCPAKFRKICEECEGLPTEKQAYLNVCRHLETSGFYNSDPEPLHHPIEKRALELVNGYQGWDFRRDIPKEKEKKFRNAYYQALKEYHDKTISLPENMKELSHGSEIPRDNFRSGSLRKAADFIPRH